MLQLNCQVHEQQTCLAVYYEAKQLSLTAHISSAGVKQVVKSQAVCYITHR